VKSLAIRENAHGFPSRDLFCEMARFINDSNLGIEFLRLTTSHSNTRSGGLFVRKNVFVDVFVFVPRFSGSSPCFKEWGKIRRSGI